MAKKYIWIEVLRTIDHTTSFAAGGELKVGNVLRARVYDGPIASALYSGSGGRIWTSLYSDSKEYGEYDFWWRITDTDGPWWRELSPLELLAMEADDD